MDRPEATHYLWALVQKKVLDSVIFNKKCGICTKHEKGTGTIQNV
jgi:hypothetical protein